MSEQPIVPPTQAEIERQRKRFESAEKKLNKLYDALDKFERKFENIDDLSSWLESMLGNKTKIEELTVSFSKDVAERKSSMDVTQNEVTQKAEDLFTKLEEDEGKFYDQLDNKTEDASKLWFFILIFRKDFKYEFFPVEVSIPLELGRPFIHVREHEIY